MKHYSAPFKRNVRGTLSRYYSVAVSHNGTRTTMSTKQTSLALAKAVVDKWRRDEIEDGALRGPDTFLEAADQWIEWKRSRISIQRYRTYRGFRNNWDHYFRQTPLREVTAEQIDRYLQIRIGTQHSPRTVNDERQMFRAIFTWARDMGWISRNPANLVERWPEKRREIKTLDSQQETALLEAAKAEGEPAYGFILCLYHTGLRRGTVSQLTWEDIDFKHGEWRISAEKMKSRRDFVGRPIAEPLLTYLKTRERRSELMFGKLGVRSWERVCAQAGVPSLRPHDLRRHFITRCRHAGVPLEVCMFLSDHRDLQTVLSCYRKVETEEARAALSRVVKS